MEAAPALGDLRLTLENPAAICPPPVKGRVFNQGSIAAIDVEVTIYAADPATGASPIGVFSVGRIDPGESVTFDETSGTVSVPTRRPVLLYGEVDAGNSIGECNENNNRFGPTNPTRCTQLN